VRYFRGNDELEEADFIMRTARNGLSEDVDAMVAVLYRTNAQSRAIEDALMREGLVYKIVGGVRFYERKEIKDALAYMRLVLNPHDDVSLRRVINVPSRGIGKGVMEAVEAIELTAADDLPLLGRPQPTLAANSLWARTCAAREKVFRAAAASLAVFRDLIVSLTVEPGRPGLHRDREDARPEWLPPGLAEDQRGFGGAHREPGGTGIGHEMKAATRSLR
jgi:hypothetical protein